jgi:alpha-D-ribose 1-methylphosphonate 5-phosphate C-P lyase
MRDGAYNYAYLDEQTKRMIRRAILKAVAVPGYQVPFGGREMPLPYGWGTGGIQVTAAIIGRDDTLKVIDQGADDTTNAVSIRRFFANVAEVATTTRTERRRSSRRAIACRRRRSAKARSWSSRCRSPSRCACSSRARPRPAPCTRSPSTASCRSASTKHRRHGRISKGYNYPVMVNGRYIMSPSPIPKFDNPKLDRSPALQLYGAGREKRIYAVPPYTPVKSLDFDDHPFEIETWEQCCELCGSKESFLDEMIVDDDGKRLFVCSDTDYCERRRTLPEAAE